MSAFTRRSFFGVSLAGILSPSADAAPPERATAIPKVPDDSPFQPSALFLTWQRDPTTSMTVQWVGAIGETPDTRVYYRPLGPQPAALASIIGSPRPFGAAALAKWNEEPSRIKPFPMTDLKVFRSELTGLLPGTSYEFRIGKQSPTYRFRTMPAKATNAIHFISGGDCGVNAHAVANNIQAARQDPMFTVIGGDLGYDNGRSVATSLAFLRNYSKHMIAKNGRLIPLVTCIGNHEVNGSFGKTREQAPFYYALFDGLFSATGYATLDFGDYLSLVLLDTNHTSAIRGAQTDWLERTLRARKDHPNVMVVNHVPAYPSFRKAESTETKKGTGEDNRKHWVPLFEKYRVPVALEHHDHTFKRTKPLIDGLANDGGVLYLGDGSWGRLRPPASPDKLSYLATSSQNYHLSLHCVHRDERFHLALDENGRVMDVCRTGQRATEAVAASR